MKYCVIRSEFNRIIDAESDVQAHIMARRICKKPTDRYFVVKESDIVRITKEDIDRYFDSLAESLAEDIYNKFIANNVQEDEKQDDSPESSKENNEIQTN